MAWYAFSNGRNGWVKNENAGAAYKDGIKYGVNYTGPYNTQGNAAQSLRDAGVKTIPPPGEKPPKGAKGKQGKKKGVAGAEIVAEARSWLGVPYLYGGTSRRGVDCSGLVQQVAFGVGLQSCPRTSEEQWGWSVHVNESDVGAGDLVFFVGAEIDPPPGHVGIIVTKGTMINAPFTGTVVRYDHYSNGTGPNQIIGYGRMPGAMYSGSANSNYDSTSGGVATGVAPAAATANVSGIVIVFIGIVVLALVVLAIVAVLIITFGSKKL